MLEVTIGGVEVTIASVFSIVETLGVSWVSYINLSRSSNMEEATSNKLGRNKLNIINEVCQG